MPRLSPSARATAWPSTMPASSTVWCASTSTSPFARTARSIRLCRPKAVSMWSKNGTPVSTSIGARAVEVHGYADIRLVRGADDFDGALVRLAFLYRWSSNVSEGFRGARDRGEGEDEVRSEGSPSGYVGTRVLDLAARSGPGKPPPTGTSSRRARLFRRPSGRRNLQIALTHHRHRAGRARTRRSPHVTPMVTRRQSSKPGAREKSRTSTPRP